MFALHIADTARHDPPARTIYAEAIDFLAESAGASRSERLVVHTLLYSLEIFSSWTMQHSVRIGLQVRELSHLLGYSAREASRFGLCSCLHDAGKLGIPVTMLEKPGKLTEQERALIETHVMVEFGFLDFFTPHNRELVAQIIRSHHENYDGTGYPDRTAKSNIPEIAQIARICDFFDAVHSERPYRKGLSLRETITLMRQSPGAFNPRLFRAFVRDIRSIDNSHLRPLH